MTILAIKNLLRNKRRTFLTSAMIIAGMIMLLLALGYVEYVKWGLGESTIRTETGHFQIATEAFWKDSGDEPLQNALENWEKLADTIRAQQSVAAVMPEIEFNGLISSGERTQGVMVNAVIPEDIITRGSVFINAKPYEALAANNDGVILGKRLAEYLNVQIGDTVTVMTNTEQGALNAIDVPVIAVTGGFVSEISKRYVCMHIKTAQSLMNTAKVQKLIVTVYDTSDTEKTIASTLPMLPGGLKLREWKSLAMMYRQVVNFFYQIIGFLTVVLVMLVWFSSMNTQLMSVLERTGEFAALRALGTGKHKILLLILMESLFLGLACVIIAVISEYGISEMINAMKLVMPPPPGSERGYELGLRNVSSNYIAVTIGTIVVVTASAIAPAFKMVRQNIADGLRRYV